MRILALEMSGRGGSVALSEDDAVLSQSILPLGKRTTQTFAAAIQSLLEVAKWKPNDIDVVGVTHGPGSFTGLRIGVTAAKSIGYAVAARVIGVDTLQIIAEQATRDQLADRPTTVTAILDAQRGQLFSATYELDPDGRLTVLVPPHLTDVGVWRERLPAGTLVTGAGLRLLPNELRTFRVADENRWGPIAETVARVVFEKARAGAVDEVWTLAPKYLRLSAPEEKRLQPPPQEQKQPE